MQIISIKATNMDMTAAIEAYVKDKLENVEKLMIDFRPEPTVTIEVGKSTNHHNKGPYFFAEFNLTVPGDILRARTEVEDLYEAVDITKDDLRRQVVEFKDKLVESKREPRPDKE